MTKLKIEPGSIVRVIRDFLTTSEGELCINSGEIIQVEEVIDRHWLLCRTQTRSGSIPSSHVTEVDIGHVDYGSKIFVANSNFDGEQEGDLTLARGTLVIGYEAVDQAWFKGKTLSGEHGVFPISFCWELDPSNYISVIKSQKNTVEKFAQVLHSMQAQLPEEIDLVEGDIVKIVEIIDKDWYRGEVKNKSGIFPASFVRIIDSFPGNRPPSSANVKPYTDAANHKNNEYMNTKAAFSGLEEGLRSIGHEAALKSIGVKPEVPKPKQTLPDEDDYFKQNLPASYGSVSQSPPKDDSQVYNVEESAFGGETARCSKGFQELSMYLGAGTHRYQNDQVMTNTNVDYNKITDNLKVFSSKVEGEPKSEPPSLDYYNRLSDSLKVFERMAEPGKDDHGPPSLDHFSKLSQNMEEVFGQSLAPIKETKDLLGPDEPISSHQKSEFRYQSVTTEGLGYTKDSVDVRPYAVSKFNFVAEFDNELGFNAGEMIYLHRYVDNEWLEGEIDAQKGLIPIKYVNVIVDCEMKEGDEPALSRSTAVTVHENLLPDTYHKVLYNFHAQMDGDITVAEGEVVRIQEKQNEDWVVVENSAGDTGVMPGNHLDPNPEFDGRMVFDIDRLLSYRSHREKILSQEPPTKRSACSKDTLDQLKFFDPLRSPDDEMSRLEQELQSKAREPKVIPLPDNKVIINPAKRKHPSDAFKQPRQPKDLETLININLSKMRGTSPKGEKLLVQANAAASKEKIDISKLVLQELRGKQYEERKHFNPFRDLAEKGFVKSDNMFSHYDTAPVQKTTKKAPPPKPPNPSKQLLRRLSSSNKPKAPPPPKPPPPKEPIYSKVKKERELSTTPPPRPSRPPLRHSQSLPTPPKLEKAQSSNFQPAFKPHDPEFNEEVEIYETLGSSNSDGSNSLRVEAEIHSAHPYDTPDEDEDDDDEDDSPPDQTPTNEVACLRDAIRGDDGGHEPLLPRRSSSIRSSVFSRLETFRSYVNTNELPSFPPDRQSPASPESASHPPKPPKAGFLPCRSASVASSIKSRLYASVASERGYSPATSSLNHSYETLNMSEPSVNGDPPPLPRGGPCHAAQLRKPHRPAPPVPVKEQFERSKEILFNNPKKQTDRNLQGVNKRNLRHRKIHSVKRQIQIKEKMLEDHLLNQEQLLRELDMYQEIAVAKGPMYEHLNRKMDHVQDTIESLSDEIQRLQACLADEELKLEEETTEDTHRRAHEESLRRQLKAQEEENNKRKQEERIKKNKERREHSIAELIQTEREFCRDLKLTWQAFALDTPEILEQRNIDVHTLFGNLKDIIEVSDAFLETLQLEVKGKTSAAEQMVGKCFLKHSERMKRVYTDYCVNKEKAEQLLEKYDQFPDIQRTLQKGVETIQSQVACFNIGSILIKPVQRILQYPLFLDKLIKCTESDHGDKADLITAAEIMTDVADFINESKKRKDIVEKYKQAEGQTLTRKISKLNMHSINKKSSRMSQKLLSTIGIDPMTRDYDFDELERRFNFLSRSCQLFAVDSQRFRECLHECALAQFNISENVADFYGDEKSRSIREVDRFRNAHRTIISTYWNQYNMILESRIVKPLQQLLDAFQGPQRLIQKRRDKHLDYSASMQKSEKNHDPMRAKAFRDEMDQNKVTYEALNTQLVEELPKLLDISTKIYTRCVKDFVLLRKLFVGRVGKELLSLLDLPLLANPSGDILEIFHIKHNLVANQISRFSFSSRNSKADDKKEKKEAAGVAGGKAGQDKKVPQNAAKRTYLRSKYAAVKLFQAREQYSSDDPLELNLSPGDLIGVIQKKDPSGSSDRWFADNGSLQGFVPAKMLVAIGDTSLLEKANLQVNPNVPPVWASESQSQVQPNYQAAKAPSIHAYDDVAEEVMEDEVEVSKPDMETLEQKVPVRKAPPVPPPIAEDEAAAAPDVVPEESQTTSEETPASSQVQDDPEGAEESNNNGKNDESTEKKPEGSKDESLVRRASHGYEEIPTATDAQSEPSQDLSPIYEEIKGGSRSTVSSSSGASSNSSYAQSKCPRGKFFYSLFDFDATDETMLSVKGGQVVRVIQVTTGGEWWYVEDRDANRGYVPNSFLKEYPKDHAHHHKTS